MESLTSGFDNFATRTNSDGEFVFDNMELSADDFYLLSADFSTADEPIEGVGTAHLLASGEGLASGSVNIS